MLDTVQHGGGEGSGKSHFFAEKLIEDSLYEKGLLSVCVREVQKTLKDSAKRLIESKLSDRGIGQADGFKIYETRIKTPGDGVIIFQGMRDHSAESIKSLEGFSRAWVEEAQTLSARSLGILRPTIFRRETSELWASWNPRRKTDPIDQLLRGDHPPPGAVVIRAGHEDNPWLPATLEAERLYDLQYSPNYRHVWEGDYATVVEGAYYASALAIAKQEGRITPLSYDPILERRAYWDLGYNDSTTIWIAQFKGQQLYVMDYIEGSGQELSYYVNELRSRGHSDAMCFIPHDGAHHHVGKSVEEHLKEAGFRVKVVPNQGRGAAMQRVEAVRRTMPRVWFNSPTCDAGIESLGAYHERRDDKRNVGLGPEHDFASDAADSFGMLCQLYEEPRPNVRRIEPPRPMGGGGGGAWMGL